MQKQIWAIILVGLMLAQLLRAHRMLDALKGVSRFLTTKEEIRAFFYELSRSSKQKTVAELVSTHTFLSIIHPDYINRRELSLLRELQAACDSHNSKNHLKTSAQCLSLILPLSAPLLPFLSQTFSLPNPQTLSSLNLYLTYNQECDHKQQEKPFQLKPMLQNYQKNQDQVKSDLKKELKNDLKNDLKNALKNELALESEGLEALSLCIKEYRGGKTRQTVERYMERERKRREGGIVVGGGEL